MSTPLQKKILALKGKELSIAKREASHWWDPPINRDDFSIYESIKGKFYLRHGKWNEELFIGGFQSIDECNQVIGAYISPKKDLGVISRIHSVLVCDKNFLKKV